MRTTIPLRMRASSFFDEHYQAKNVQLTERNNKGRDFSDPL